VELFWFGKRFQDSAGVPNVGDRWRSHRTDHAVDMG
jgi:hypothetical protein